MKLTLKNTQVTGLSETQGFLISPNHPVRIQAVPQSKVELFIDGVKQTGTELVNGKHAQLKKADKNLVLSLDGEPLVEITDFYATEGVSLDGAGWQFSNSDALGVQNGTVVSLANDEITPQALPLAVLAGAGPGLGLVAVLGGLGLIAAGGGGNSLSPLEAALAKIEAYNNGNGQNTPVPTVQDYTDAGVTGVTVDNLAAVNAQVLKQSTGGADSTAKIQALTLAANAALAKIEAFNNGNGTNPEALTVSDYEEAGISGVNANNLAAINAKILALPPGGADTAPEIQGVATALLTAIAKIEAYNIGNGTTPTALTLDDYVAAGISGVTLDNLASVNAQVLKQDAGGADSPLEVQQLVSAANTALQKIEDYNNGNGTLPSALTVSDYLAAGITGVTADNLAAVNARVLAQTPGGANSDPKIQLLVESANSAIAKIEAFNNGNGNLPVPLTVSDYMDAGITGVTVDNLAAVNAQVLAQIPGGANSDPKIQLLVESANSAIAKIEAFNNGNGTLPVPLTLADYLAAGITGVTADNLIAVNVQVLNQSVGGANTDLKIQTVVTGVNNAVAALSAFAQANASGLSNATGSIPDLLSFSDAGLTGVTATNLSSIDDALASAKVDASRTDTPAKIQAIINDYIALLASADGIAGNTSTPLTAAQFDDIGIDGVTPGSNQNLLNSVIDGKSKADVNTVSEVQALADAAKAVMAGAAAGTAPTKAQLELLGVANITDGNLAAVQAAINATNDDGSGVDSLAKLQTIVANTVLSALAEIQAAAEGDTANSTTPALTTYATAGISGVTAGNLAAINSALDSTVVNGNKADTTAKVQIIVDAYKAILTAADGPMGTNAAPLTGDQFAAVGVTGVSGSTAPAGGTALHLLDDAVDLSASTMVNTYPALQHMADAAAHIMSDVAGGATATVADFAYLGILGVTAANLGAVRTGIDNATAHTVDTVASLQSVVNSIIGTPTLETALGNVTNLDVTSNLVLTSFSAVKLGASGMIHIHQTGGAGYNGAITPSSHDVDIDLSTAAGRSLVTMDASGTKITINPTWDLDLGANYTLSMDAGAFVDLATGTHDSRAVSGVGFSTVTPGFHGSGHTVAQDAVASQMMQADGSLAASKFWASIQDIGNINTPMAELGSLAGGSYALVVKNYAQVAGGTPLTGDGVALHDTNVSVTNFGANDVLYIDNQANNAATQNIDLRYSDLLAGGVNHGGTADQTILSFGTTSLQSYGTSQIALGFEGNSTNQVFHAIYDVPGTPGFASFLHSQPVIAG